MSIYIGKTENGNVYIENENPVIKQNKKIVYKLKKNDVLFIDGIKVEVNENLRFSVIR